MGGWNLVPTARQQVQEEDHNAQGRNILEMEPSLPQETGRVRVTSSSRGMLLTQLMEGALLSHCFFVYLFY